MRDSKRIVVDGCYKALWSVLNGSHVAGFSRPRRQREREQWFRVTNCFAGQARAHLGVCRSCRFILLPPTHDGIPGPLRTSCYGFSGLSLKQFRSNCIGRSNQVTTVGSQFQMSVVESCSSQLDGRGEENVGAKPISRISQRRTEGELRKRACNSPGDMELWKTKFGRLPEMGWWRRRRRATTANAMP